MKTKIKVNNNSKIKRKKKSGKIILKEKNSNSLKYKFFNQTKSNNKISIVIDFLDTNEQLPLLKLNSIISKIIINKFPIKSLDILNQIKNDMNSYEPKFSNLFFNFNKIIEKNNFKEEEYQFVFTYLLKNINDNYIFFDSLFPQDYLIDDANDFILKMHKIFAGILKKIQYINKITHIKFKIANLDKQIKDIHLNKEIFNELYFSNFFKNINHLEIDNVEKSLCFINKLLSYDNNLISNVTKINLSNINIKMSNEEIIDYNIYNSLSFPKLTKLKYLSLVKINLSIFCLNEIISKNSNLIRIVILQCSNNLYDKKEYAKLLNKSIKNCKELNYVNFNNNNFSIYLINQIVYTLMEIFFKSNKINLIYCEYPINKENYDKNCIFELPKHLKKYANIIDKKDYNKYLTIKFNPALAYSIKKNKCIIDVSSLQNKKTLKGINYEKIKLTLDSWDNDLNSNKLKKIMRKFYQKGITKYLQIFCSFPKRSLMNFFHLHKNKDNEMYKSIEKVTIYFQDEDSSGILFGDRIILSILSFFPYVKIISFKNVHFRKYKIKLYTESEIFDLFHNKNNHQRENKDKNDYFGFVLFGVKNKDLDLFKNKEIYLREIRFNNCYFKGILIGKDITQEIEETINSYLGKNVIRVIYVE